MEEPRKKTKVKLRTGEEVDSSEAEFDSTQGNYVRKTPTGSSLGTPKYKKPEDKTDMDLEEEAKGSGLAALAAKKALQQRKALKEKQ